MDLFPQPDSASDLGFVQNASVTTEFTFQWKVRVMAEEAMQEEMADIKLRRILSRDQPFVCAGVADRESAVFPKQIGFKSTPRWQGPAILSDIDEAGVTAKF